MKRYIGMCSLFCMAFACQKKSELKIIKWEAGDNPAILEQIESVEKSKEKVTAYYNNKPVRFAFQNHDGVRVANTFIKSVGSGNSSLLNVQAGIYPKVSVQLVPGFKRKLNPTQLRRDLEPLLPKPIRTMTTDFEYSNVNGVLQSRLLLDVELADGNLWRGSFDESGHLVDLQQLGSHLANGIDSKITVYDRGPKFSSLAEILVKNILTFPTVSNSQVLVTSEGFQKISNISATMKFDPKDERFDQLQTFYYISRISDWIRENLNVTLPNQLTAVVNVGFPEATNTAFYFQNKIRFGRGDDVTYTSLTADPSIVYHETFHAMIDAIAHLPFEKQGGSLNEAFADFFTCVALDRPYLAENSYLKGPFKRSLKVDYKLSDKNGGLYHDSQIVSGFLWDVRTEFGKSLSLKIALEILLRLHPMSDFEEFNLAAIASSKSILNPDQMLVFGDLLKKRGFRYE